MKKSFCYICLLTLCLYACGGKQNNTDSRTNVIHMGVMSSMDYLPIALAYHNGYFKDESIEVYMEKFFSANDRDAAIRSGSLDGSILDYTGAAIQKAGGVDLFIISQCDGTFELMASKNISTNGKVDLKGKNFAVSRNTVIDFCTDIILLQSEIEMQEIKKIEINKIPLRLEMLNSGQIDLTVLPDPFVTIAKSNGHISIATINDFDCRATGIVFTQEAINKKTDAIKAFYRAYNRAIEYIKSQPIEDIQKILIDEIGFPDKTVSNIILPEYHKATTPNIKDLKIVEEWLKNRGLINNKFDINSLINTKFNIE